MRCAYKEAKYSEAERTLGIRYGEWAMEWCDTSFGVILAEQYGFGKVRLQRIFDGIRKNICEAMEANVPDTVYVNFKGRQKGGERERFEDARTQVVFNQSKRFEAVGFSDKFLERIEAEQNNAPVYRQAKLTTTLRSSRWFWYEINGRDAMKLYCGALLLLMVDEYNFGKQRLEKLYDEFVPYVKRYWEYFMYGDLKQDDRMRTELNRMHGVLEAHGVELIDVPGDDIVTVKKHTQTMEPIPNTTHEDFGEMIERIKKERAKGK